MTVTEQDIEYLAQDHDKKLLQSVTTAHRPGSLCQLELMMLDLVPTVDYDLLLSSHATAHKDSQGLEWYYVDPRYDRRYSDDV